MTGVSRVASVALQGLNGHLVTVEAGVTRQLPGISIVGLPDATLTEAKQRVRHAAAASRLALTDRFVLVNLQPADLPKHGSGFDLPIALAALAASGHLPHDGMHETVHLGELGLDGSLRRPRGLLTGVLAAKNLGVRCVMVPAESAVEAAAVSDIEIVAVKTLREAVAHYRGDLGGAAVVRDAREASLRQSDTNEHGDISEVVGQDSAVRAFTIAAAGAHHVQMTGPPGAGKTLLASRFVSILPDLTPDEAIEVGSIRSLVSRTALTEISCRPPFHSPHHTSSAASIIGSGTGGMVLPGIVTQATHGVLFLDEAAEFKPSVLDALRQPLESGVIEIHRAGVHAKLPARVQLVLASNPCPCGYGGASVTAAQCVCTPSQRRRYATKISGPIRDRIDLHLEVQRVTVAASINDLPRPSSAELRERVSAAREVARDRWADTPWRLNAQVPGSHLRNSRMRLPPSTVAALDRALQLGRLTLRGYDRAVRIAWTISDLEGSTLPNRDHVAQALTLRGAHV